MFSVRNASGTVLKFVPKLFQVDNNGWVLGAVTHTQWTSLTNQLVLFLCNNILIVCIENMYNFYRLENVIYKTNDTWDT